MMKGTKKVDNVPDQGYRTPRSRREGSPVPAALPSLSNDGLPTPCTSGGVGERASEGRRKEETPGGSGGACLNIGTGSAVATGRELPRVVAVRIVKPGPKSSKANFEAVKATVCSPPPLQTPAMSDGEEVRQYFSGSDDTSVLSTGDTGSPATSSGSDGSARTTASGTIKRRKKESSTAPKTKRGRACKRQQDPVVDLTSGEEEELAAAAAALTPRKETRGRPPSIGEGFFAREKALAKRELKDLQEEHQRLQRLLNGEFEPRDFKGGPRKEKEAALEAEMKNLPTRDIVAQMVLAARRVDEIAGKPGNLKGGFVRQLKEAALSVEVGADALATRGAGEPEASSSLRAEISVLMAENRALRAEKERGWGPPPTSSEAARARDPSPLVEVEMTELSATGDAPPRSESRRPPPEGPEAEPPLTTVRPPMTAEERRAFPALRPALRGKRRNLEGPPEEQRPPRKTPPKNRPQGQLRPANETSGGGGGVGAVAGAVAAATMTMAAEQLEARLQLFQEHMMKEMRRFFLHLRGGEGERGPVPTVRATPARTDSTCGGPASTRGRPQPPPPTSEGGRKKKKGGNTKGEMLPTPRTKTAADESAVRREEPTWAKVMGRKERRANRPPPPPPPSSRPSPPARGTAGQMKTAQGPAKIGSAGRKLRPPRTSAVTITCPKGTYAEVIAGVRANVPLAPLGLTPQEVSVRRGATGATVVEVAGLDREEKADRLAAAIRGHLTVSGATQDIRVDRPVKTADLRVSGLEASVSAAEATRAVAEKGGCAVEVIKTGAIRPAPRGMNSLWLRLPVAAAKRAAEGNTIHVGWSRARVEVLGARPLRCHRCLERGHVMAACSGDTDRSGRCYRCSGTGHTAKECSAPPKCPLCTDIGRKAGHSLGAPECAPQGRRGAGTRPGPAAAVSRPKPSSSEGAGVTAAPSSPAPLPPRPATRRATRSTSGAAAATALPSSSGPSSASAPTKGACLVPADQAEPPKPRRARRRTTRPLEDKDESEELERAVARMEVDSGREGADTI